jgi:ribosome-associated protein
MAKSEKILKTTAEKTTTKKTTAAKAEKTAAKRAAQPKKLPAQVAHAIAAAEDKQAKNIVALDLRKTGGFTDFFLIASGTNTRQVRAIADGVMERLAADGAKPAYIEGYERSEWILLDYFDFIVHIFAPETRTFYDLERLWGSADRTEIPTTA